MRISHVCALSAALLLVGGCSRETPPTPAAPTAKTAAPAAPAPPATPAIPAKDAVFGQEELDQMLAPLALYPDPLLAQVLMAATYPGDVLEAAAWSKAHPDAKGDQAVRQVATQPWDPSVQALVAFPQALATLGQDPAWVQRLGDAFLAQPDDVMDAVQRLRHQAQSAGNLESNKYQNVTIQPAEPAMGGTTVQDQPESSTIIIEPANPEVVYVPAYNPTEAYGTWAYPSYPPAYYPPAPGYYMGSALAAGLAFGVGVAITDSLWGDFDWGGDDIDIDVDRYNNINVNRQLNVTENNWRHNAANRDGVPYRDRANREQYSRRLEGADSREAFRGEDAQRARSREQARASMQSRGFDTPATSNREARDRVREADRNQARERARDTQQRTQARDRSTQQARDRSAQQARERSQSRDRGGSTRTAADRDRSQNRQQQRPRSQSNAQSRQSARQQSSGGHTRNNAFEGSRSPSASRAQQDRGRASHTESRRSSSSSRSSGRPVNRQSQAPQRQSRRG